MIEGHKERFSRDLRYFVRRRYAEVIDFSEYEPKIKKLIDTYVGTGEIVQITEQVNIFDKEKFAEEVENLRSGAAKADTIAHRTMRTITQERTAGEGDNIGLNTSSPLNNLRNKLVFIPLLSIMPRYFQFKKVKEQIISLVG